MLHKYETTFGIHNHDKDSATGEDALRPLALVEMHWAENTDLDGRLYERMQQYMDRDVFKYFGESWSSFLNLPTHECMRMLEMCAKKQDSYLKQKAQGLADAEKILSGESDLTTAHF